MRPLLLLVILGLLSPSAFGAVSLSSGELFVVDRPNNQIVTLDADTGAMLNSFATPATTYKAGLAAHENSLWFATPPGMVYTMDASTGAVTNSFYSPLEAGPFGVSSLAYGWVDDGEGGQIDFLIGLSNDTEQLIIFDPFTGALINSFSFPFNLADGLAFNPISQTIYVGDFAISDIIYEIDPMTGAVLNSFASPGTFVTGLAFVGDRLFAVDNTTNLIYELDPFTGAVLDSFASSVTSPYALAGRGVILEPTTVCVETHFVGSEVYIKHAETDGEFVFAGFSEPNNIDEPSNPDKGNGFSAGIFCIDDVPIGPFTVEARPFGLGPCDSSLPDQASGTVTEMDAGNTLFETVFEDVLPIVNPDLTKPELSFVSFNQETYDVTDTPQTVFMSVDAFDVTPTDPCEVVSGFSVGLITVCDPEGKVFTTVPFGDTDKSALFNPSFILPQCAMPGTYTIKLEIQDVAGNQQLYGDQNMALPFPGESVSEFEVVLSGTATVEVTTGAARAFVSIKHSGTDGEFVEAGISDSGGSDPDKGEGPEDMGFLSIPDVPPGPFMIMAEPILGKDFDNFAVGPCVSSDPTPGEGSEQSDDPIVSAPSPVEELSPGEIRVGSSVFDNVFDSETAAFLTIKADVSNAVAEADEDNNFCSLPFFPDDFVESSPDLAIPHAWAISGASPGDVEYQITVVNRGFVPLPLTGSNIAVQTYLSADDQFDPGIDIPAGGYDLASTTSLTTLRTGQTITILPFTSSPGLDPAATPYLICVVDSGDTVFEEDETNNVFVATIDPPEGPLPELIVSDCQITDFSEGGIFFTYTIKNVGRAPANLNGPDAICSTGTPGMASGEVLCEDLDDFVDAFTDDFVETTFTQDVTGPVVTGISYEFDPVDITDAAQQVGVSVILSDLRGPFDPCELVTGFSTGTIQFIDPSGEPFGPAQMLTSTVSNVMVDVPLGSEVGTYTVEMMLTDFQGNTRFFGGTMGEPFPDGVEPEFEVMVRGLPTLSVTTALTNSLVFLIDSGMNLTEVGRYDGTNPVVIPDVPLGSYTVYAVPVLMPPCENAELGEVMITLVEDDLGATVPVATTESVVPIIGPDATPPVLDSFVFDVDPVDVTSGGQIVGVTMEATDGMPQVPCESVSGFASGTVALRDPAGELFLSVPFTAATIDTVTLTLPAGTSRGLYALEVTLVDNAGNTSFYDGGEVGLGFPETVDGDLEVLNTNPPAILATVLDDLGVALQGATVSITDTAGFRNIGTTDALGQILIPNVAVGAYTIVAELILPCTPQFEPKPGDNGPDKGTIEGFFEGWTGSFRGTVAAGDVGMTLKNTVNTTFFSDCQEPSPQTFDAWAEGFGLEGADAAPGADADKDGGSNLYEAFSGTDPTDSSSANPPVLTIEEGHLTLTVNRGSNVIAGLSCDCEATVTGGWMGSATGETEIVTDTPELFKARDTKPVGDSHCRLLRILVSQEEP